jgi:hypothetical protein
MIMNDSITLEDIMDDEPNKYKAMDVFAVIKQYTEDSPEFVAGKVSLIIEKYTFLLTQLEYLNKISKNKAVECLKNGLKHPSELEHAMEYARLSVYLDSIEKNSSRYNKIE